MRYASFILQSGTKKHPENSVDGKNSATYRIDAFFARKKKRFNSYIISRPVKIIWPAASWFHPLSLFAPALYLASLPPRKDARGGILVRTTHHPLCHIRSINSRLEPLGATNKTIKPFN